MVQEIGNASKNINFEPNNDGSFKFDNTLKSGLSEVRIAERTPIIELNSVYPLSDLRDDQQTINNGSIIDTESEFQLRHVGSGDFVSLRSSSRGRYLPGLTAEAGIGVRMDKVPSDGDYVAKWGYFDMELDANNNNTSNINNGLLFGQDSTDLFVEVVRNGSSIHKTYRSDWNIDDGDDINILNGNIFQIDFTYYGYGLIKWQVVDGDTGNENQKTRTVHTFRPSNQTSLENTNLQIGALGSSTNTGSDISLFVGGRQFSVVGKFMPRTRLTSETVTGKSVGTGSFTHLMSFRRKADRREISTELFSIDTITDNDVIVRIDVGGSLSGSSFGSISNKSDSETGLQVDTAGSNFGGGINVYEGLVSGAEQGNRTEIGNLTDLPQSTPDEALITFRAKAIDTTATVDMTAKIREEF